MMEGFEDWLDNNPQRSLVGFEHDARQTWRAALEWVLPIVTAMGQEAIDDIKQELGEN